MWAGEDHAEESEGEFMGMFTRPNAASSPQSKASPCTCTPDEDDDNDLRVFGNYGRRPYRMFLVSMCGVTRDMTSYFLADSDSEGPRDKGEVTAAYRLAAFIYHILGVRLNFHTPVFSQQLEDELASLKEEMKDAQRVAATVKKARDTNSTQNTLVITSARTMS